MRRGEVRWYTFDLPDKRRPVLILSPCAANLDNVQTVPKPKLGALIATLSAERMAEVDRAFAFALGMARST